MISALVLIAVATVSPDLDWLSGHWLSCADNGTQTTEVWVGAGSGLLAGVNHTQRAGRTPAFEFMRIGPGRAGTSFFASPGGAPPVEFALVAHNGSAATFENLAHDFPHRVIYSRNGETLTGRIEGAVDGHARSIEWRFQRVEPGAACR